MIIYAFLTQFCWLNWSWMSKTFLVNFNYYNSNYSELWLSCSGQEAWFCWNRACMRSENFSSINGHKLNSWLSLGVSFPFSHLFLLTLPPCYSSLFLFMFSRSLFCSLSCFFVSDPLPLLIDMGFRDLREATPTMWWVHTWCFARGAAWQCFGWLLP